MFVFSLEKLLKDFPSAKESFIDRRTDYLTFEEDTIMKILILKISQKQKTLPKLFNLINYKNIL